MIYELGTFSAVKLAGSEEELKKRKASLPYIMTQAGQTKMHLKHTSTKYQHRFYTDFLAVFPHRLFTCSDRNSEGWIHSSPAWNCRTIWQAARKKNSLKLKESLAAPWLRWQLIAKPARWQRSVVEVQHPLTGSTKTNTADTVFLSQNWSLMPPTDS